MIDRTKPQTDFRPRCRSCGARWLPPEGVDAQVTPCPACRKLCDLCLVETPLSDDGFHIIDLDEYTCSAPRYRGLLATLSPRVEIDGLLVTVYVTVPDRETGEPFELRTAERVTCESEIRPAIVRCFCRALEHEVREGLSINDH